MADVQENIVRVQLEKIAKEHNYDDFKTDITAITSEGANYTSVLFLATISATGKPELKLFCKVSAVGEKFRQQMLIPAFDIENYFYTTVSKIYDRIQDKYDIPAEDRYRMPKFYSFDDTFLQEVLVLEDLSAEGFTTHDRFKGMDWQYASRTLEELAKWHALSIVFQEEYPKEFENTVEFLKIMELGDDNKMVTNVKQSSANTVRFITDENVRERLRKYLEKSNDMDLLKIFGRPLKRPVLAYGDFRMSNIMHKFEKDKLHVVPLDYQCIHIGCGLRDVMFFLLSGTDEEFRGKNFYPLLDHYYEQICISLRRLNRDPEVVYPRQDLDYELEKVLPWGMFIAMAIMPVVTVEAKDAPSLDQDDFEVFATIKTSKLYETRINGLIRDFLKWGVI